MDQGQQDLMDKAQQPCSTSTQQHPCRSCPAPSTVRGKLGLAATSFLLVAIVTITIAVPVASARPTALEDSGSSTGRQLEQARSRAARQEASSRVQLLSAEPACLGVPGLCKVPVRLVTFPGTHNSNSIKTTFPTLAEHQQLTFAEQLKAGGRLFDLDYAGGPNGARFGHCMSCLCAFSTLEKENDPAAVFKTMADFLTSNPSEVLVIGLSNINCGDKDAARQQLLGILAASSLLKFAALQPVGPNTKLGELVDSNQRAIFLFYDEWVTPAGHRVGGKYLPNQALWRIYGGGVSVDGKDAATIDQQTSQGLTNDVIKQISTPQPALSPNTPWRIMGLFPSSCLACRSAGVCGPISCAEKANSESFIMYALGKATARWTRSRTDQSQLVPAFNGFQIDYLQAMPKNNVVTAAQKLNAAIAWMYTAQAVNAPKLGLGNCVWVMDDTAAAGGLACAAGGAVKVPTLLGLPAASGGRRLQQQQPAQEAGSNSKRQILVPANPALTLRILGDGKLRREVKGVANQAQLLDLALAATDVQVVLA